LSCNSNEARERSHRAVKFPKAARQACCDTPI
jgi:hypothetical protein